MTSFGGKIKLLALSMVCESQYSGWFHTIDLAHDPDPLLQSNLEEFKKLIKKKNRYVICNQHPILLPGKMAVNYEPYNEIGSEILNERVKKVFKKNKNFHESKLLSLNIRKAQKELQWKPRLNLDETVRFTVDWYKNYFLRIAKIERDNETL